MVGLRSRVKRTTPSQVGAGLLAFGEVFAGLSGPGHAQVLAREAATEDVYAGETVRVHRRHVGGDLEGSGEVASPDLLAR